MTKRIAHRGPDSAGSWSHEDERVTAPHLGFRRLSIIDLSPAADQPLHKDGLTIIYNGERLIADDHAGRQDNAKQIWQLLSMELWYRSARSMGVAA